MTDKVSGPLPTKRAVNSAVGRPDFAAIRRTYETVDAHPRILRSGLRLIGSNDILDICDYVEELERALRGETEQDSNQ